VILYGSRARGDWEAASGIDVVVFQDAGEAGNVAT
jgi:predicted nucleotidyltransferase